jgi:hypothetical protein
MDNWRRGVPWNGATCLQNIKFWNILGLYWQGSVPLNELNYSVFFSSLNTGWAEGQTVICLNQLMGGFNWYHQAITGEAFRRDINFYNR